MCIMIAGKRCNEFQSKVHLPQTRWIIPKTLQFRCLIKAWAAIYRAAAITDQGHHHWNIWTLDWLPDQGHNHDYRQRPRRKKSWRRQGTDWPWWEKKNHGRRTNLRPGGLGEESVGICWGGGGLGDGERWDLLGRRRPWRWNWTVAPREKNRDQGGGGMQAWRGK